MTQKHCAICKLPFTRHPNAKICGSRSCFLAAKRAADKTSRGTTLRKLGAKDNRDARHRRNEQIIRERSDGKTYQEISRQFGVSPERVGDIVRASNLPRFKVDRRQEENAQRNSTILRLLREGLSCDAVGRRVGLTNQTVWYVGKKHGFVLMRNCENCGKPFRAAKGERTCPGACREKWRETANQRLRERSPQAYDRRMKKNTRNWRAANPHKVKEQQKRAWLRGDPVKRRETRKRWSDANPGLRALYVNRRRVRKLSAGGSHTIEEAANLLKAQRHKCAMCRTDLRKVKRHRDHIVPLSKGGNDNISNIQWLCSRCNTRKGNKDPLDFARDNGLLL